MIRFICVVVFLILFLILTIPVFFIEWLIGKFNRNARDYSCLRIVQWGFKAILKVTGVHTTVIGFENIPDEPVLFIGNHRICGEKGDGKNSAFIYLDALCILPVSGPRESKRGTENHPSGDRLCEAGNFHLYFP